MDSIRAEILSVAFERVRFSSFFRARFAEILPWLLDFLRTINYGGSVLRPLLPRWIADVHTSV